MNFHIQGFGACMVGGFPHRKEDSFFHHAIQRLQKESAHHIVPSLFTMDAFPVTRVPKHLPARCLAAKPDIVVLQFGSSDLIVPTRRRLHHGSTRPVHREVIIQSPSLVDRWRWAFRSLVGDGLRLAPVTAPEIYLETMTQIARTLLEHQVIPVVMSPFVFGGGRSDRIARDCANRLRESLSGLPGAVYVDAFGALDRHPRRRMLLVDGLHLSLEGQRVLAEALYPCLKNLVDKHPGGPQ